MKLKIITLPDKRLRQISKPVEKIDRKIIKLIADMAETLHSGPEGEEVGVGLSAVQVGKLRRLFLAKVHPKKDFQPFINPEIVKTAEKEILRPSWMEGCLSAPGFYGHVRRFREVTLKFQTPDGKWHEETFRSFSGVVIQHELDHLNGILFIDHLMNQKAPLFELRQTDKGEEMVKTDINYLPATWKT